MTAYREQVVIDREQFDRLPVELGQSLARMALSGAGFRVISRETGEEVTDRLDHYLIGTLVLAWHQTVQRVGERG